MTVFVLIHGAFHGGWCFDRVAERLRADGHHVVAPDLPGMGGDAESLAAATLEGWADFTLNHCRQLREQTGQRVVLAGHSRGGMVISAAAERDPAAMDALAYICAIMTPVESRLAEMKEKVLTPPELVNASRAVADGAGIMIEREAAIRHFAHDLPTDVAQDAASRLVAEPVVPLSTPLIVTNGRWGSVPRTYIECLDDRAIPIASQRVMIAMSPGTDVVSLPSGHSPMLGMPDRLAQVLEGL